MSNTSLLNELALAKGLSRTTHSVTRDTKRLQLIIVQEVSSGLKDTEGYRYEQTYYMYVDPKTCEVNALLCKSRDLATMAFLGLEDDAKPATVSEPIVDIDTPEVKEEVKVEEKPKPAKKPRKKAAPKKEAPKVAPAEVYEAPVDDGLGLDDDEDDTNELYQKGTVAHAAHLKSILNEKFGKGWPKEKATVAIVKKLVAEITDSVAVVDGEGEMLASFEEYVLTYLKKA